MSRNYNSAPENDGDDSDGCDGSRGSAHEINDNNLTVMTATNQEKTSSYTIKWKALSKESSLPSPPSLTIL